MRARRSPNATTISFPSGLNEAASAMPVEPTRSRTRTPLATSHTAAVPSPLEVTSDRPSVGAEDERADSAFGERHARPARSSVDDARRDPPSALGRDGEEAAVRARRGGENRAARSDLADPFPSVPDEPDAAAVPEQQRA